MNKPAGPRGPWRQRHLVRRRSSGCARRAPTPPSSSSSIGSTATPRACCIVAKKRGALTGLHAQLRDGAIDKRYDVLVRGKWRDALRAVELSLTSYVTSDGERRVRVDAARATGADDLPAREGVAARRARRRRCSKPSSRRAARTRSAFISRISGFPARGRRQVRRFRVEQDARAAGPEADVPARAPDSLRASGRRPRGGRRGAAPAGARCLRRAPRWRPPMADPPTASPRRYRFVVFDWDGTLADSTAIIAEALQQACRDVGEPVPDDGRRAIRDRARPRRRAAARRAGTAGRAAPRARGALPAPLFRARACRFRCSRACARCWRELNAAGYVLGVATGKSRAGLDHALDQQDVRHFFAATRCADEGFSKPHPDMLLRPRTGRREPGRDVDDRRYDARPRARAQRRRRGAGGRVRRARRRKDCVARSAARDICIDRGASRLARRTTR